MRISKLSKDVTRTYSSLEGGKEGVYFRTNTPVVPLRGQSEVGQVEALGDCQVEALVDCQVEALETLDNSGNVAFRGPQCDRIVSVKSLTLPARMAGGREPCLPQAGSGVRIIELNRRTK